MNWVAPIKDDETLEKFKAKLREMDDKYYIMFEIGVGTGLQLQEILKFKNKDIRGKDSIRGMYRHEKYSPDIPDPAGAQGDYHQIHRGKGSGGISYFRACVLTGSAVP